MTTGKSLCRIPKYRIAFEEYGFYLWELSIKFIVACEADLPWGIPRRETKRPRAIWVSPPVAAMAQDPAFVQRICERHSKFGKKGAVRVSQVKYDGGWGWRGNPTDGRSSATEVLGEPSDDIEIVADPRHSRLWIAHAVEGKDDIVGSNWVTIVEGGPFLESKGIGRFILGKSNVCREIGN